MAIVTRVNGTVVPSEQVGRDLKFVKLNVTGIETTYNTVDSDFEKNTRMLQQFCSITIVGTPASSNVVYVVEGLPVTVGGTAIATVLKTAGEAAAGGTQTWTIYDGLSGATFA